MGVSFYCDVDENGKIIESLIGDRIIPMKQYDYFFYITGKSLETVLQELPNYRVVDRELVFEPSPNE
ncbi:hypothetical protein [Bacillus sp. 1P02SD]|uniref:hypothetical protein n=1 Tax=Bacillus sp. 1P02SD TaxID=3132264 RepID=UPI0039A115D4